MELIGPYYLAFLIITVCLFYLIPSRFKVAFLAFTSFGFISTFGELPLLTILAIVLWNYLIALKMDRLQKVSQRHRTLVLSMAVNLLILGLFKYYNGINRGSAFLADLLEVNNPIPHVEWILPIGISYYIFQAIGYQIEVYRKSHPAEKRIGHLSTYLAFFPKLTAGPIERSNTFIKRLDELEGIRFEHVQTGARLILWGVFKFMFIGDLLSGFIDPTLHKHSDASGLAIILALSLYTVQVYAQFSGYTDIALGSARLFGIPLRINFNRPFLSTSLSDFWRRWHISLSSWVMDYIFTPLSMWLSLRISPGRMTIAVAVFLSFAILGLWHGASWNFAVFGLIQGIVLGLEILTLSQRKKWMGSQFFKTLGIGFTLGVFTLSTAFFRTSNIGEVMNWAQKSTSVFQLEYWKWFQLKDFEIIIILGAAIFLLVDHILLKKGFEQWISSKHPILRWMIYGALIYAIIAGSEVSIHPIIYGQF